MNKEHGERSKRCGPESDWDLVYRKDVIDRDWFYGLLPRYVIVAVEKDGVPELFLVHRHLNCNYYPIRTDGRQFWVWSGCKFDSVSRLIEEGMAVGLSVDKGVRLNLARTKPKPSWYLKRSDIAVDKKLLGSGNFCNVFCGKLKSRIVAVKVCHSHQDNDEGQKGNDALLKEAGIMSKLNNLNVICFYGICCDRSPVMIAIEFCPGGALVDHLVREGEKVVVGERLKFCIEAARGMQYLHSANLVHRDLAARNCLISQYGIVKISDFGLSMICKSLNGESRSTDQIPLRWMAPETLVANAQYSMASDCWAFGMLVFEVFNMGEKPWPDWEHKRIATHIRRVQMPDMPSRTPPEIKDLVHRKIWEKDPQKRPSFVDVVRILEKFALKHRPPSPARCSVANLPNVRPMSEDELAVLCDNPEATFDVAMEARTEAKIAAEKSRFVNTENYVLKDGSKEVIKEVVKEKDTAKKKKKGRRNATISQDSKEYSCISSEDGEKVKKKKSMRKKIKD